MQLRLAKRRDVLRGARDLQACEQHGWWQRWSLRLRQEARQPLRRADPEISAAVAEGGRNRTARKPVSRRVVLDATRRRIETVETLSRADVDASVEVFGDGEGDIARETLRGRVIDEGGMLGALRIDATDAARRGDPQ